jgi:hypothetical protein
MLGARAGLASVALAKIDWSWCPAADYVFPASRRMRIKLSNWQDLHQKVTATS